MLPTIKEGRGRRSKPKKKAWPFNTVESLNEVVDPEKLVPGNKQYVVFAKKRRSKSSRNNNASVKLTPLDKLASFIKKSSSNNQETYHHKTTTPEQFYAAVCIQSHWRGHVTRSSLWSSNGLMAHKFAIKLQRVFRGIQGRRAAALQRTSKQRHAITVIVNWNHRIKKTEREKLSTVSKTRYCLIRIQAIFRGGIGRRKYEAIRLEYRNQSASALQATIRRWIGRRRIASLLKEKEKQFNHLKRIASIHQYVGRCGRCNIRTSTPASLVDCIMARHLGLHDFAGAKLLCRDGLVKFPNNPVFKLLYACLLLVTCESLEVAMTYVENTTFNTNNIERRYYEYALQCWPGDATIYLDYCVFLQCTKQFAKALSYYKKLFEIRPQLYNIQGYDNRCYMASRVTQNYRIFRSVFNNTKVLRLQPSEKVRMTDTQTLELRMYQHHQYFIIQHEEEEDNTRSYNKIYLTEEEVGIMVKEINRGYYLGSTAFSTIKILPKKKTEDDDNSTDNRITSALAKKIRRDTVLSPKDAYPLLNAKPSLSLGNRVLKEMLHSVVLLPSSSTTGGVLILPLIAKIRQHVGWNNSLSRAIINIQRTVRGWSARCKLRLAAIEGQAKSFQMRRYVARIENRREIRERRADAAVGIQSLWRGMQTRMSIVKMHQSASVLQCAARCRQARKKADWLRSGHVESAPTECVFHAGTHISHKRCMLRIDKCGLSFAFTALDLKTCSTYTGTLPSTKFTAIIHHARYLTAKSLVGASLQHPMQTKLLGTVRQVTEPSVDIVWSSYERGLFEIKLLCEFQDNSKEWLELEQVIYGIRYYSSNNKSSDSLKMPVSVKDTDRAVSLLLEWMKLVPSINAPTFELKKQEAELVIAVVPPSAAELSIASADCLASHTSIIRSVDRDHVKMHHMRHQGVSVRSSTTNNNSIRIRTLKFLRSSKANRRKVTHVSHTSALHRKPHHLHSTENLEHIVELHRIRSVLTMSFGLNDDHARTYYTPCIDHRSSYVHCGCYQSTSDVSVHVSTLENALEGKTAAADDLSLKTLQAYHIPNPSRFRWFLPDGDNDAKGVCSCAKVFCDCAFY